MDDQSKRLTDSILRVDQVCKRLGVSRTTIWRWVKARRFPAPVRLSANIIGFKASSVADWIESRDEV